MYYLWQLNLVCCMEDLAQKSEIDYIKTLSMLLESRIFKKIV